AEISLSLSASIGVASSTAKAELDTRRVVQQWTGTPEVRNYSAGLGFHTPLSNNADIYVAAKYVKSDLKFGGRSVEADGIGADVGIRALLSPALELEGVVKYIGGDDFEEDFGYRANLRFYISPAFSLSAGYFDGDRGDAADGFVAGIRFNF